jgi:cysteinyl-tRNA synthetase
VHNGMLQLGGEKMSKSTGNLITIEDFLSKHSADTLRFMVLNSAYRSPLTFTDEVIAQAEKGLERLLSGLRPALPGTTGAPSTSLEALAAQVEKTQNGFCECMDDDFNSAGALGNLFDLVRTINQSRGDGATASELSAAQTLLRQLTSTLGLKLELSSTSTSPADPFVDLLVNLRTEMRRQKLWVLSDQIRDRLAALDVVIEDSKEGTLWRWKG